AQMERRVLAGEFDPDPDDTVPDAVLLRWLDQDGPPPEESPPDAPAAERSSAHRGDPGDGWWARADRAVDQASTALLGLERALGHARRTVATARRADTTDEATWAASPAGRVSAAPDVLTQLAAATEQACADLAALLAATAGGGLTDRPRIALTDAAGGALLALTDLPALHRAARTGTGLGAAAASPGYRPSAALDRHVRARDRRCRFPGCRRPVPRGGELDHAVPWPAGPTTAANLTGYCTGHHRGKHQAPGWRHVLAPDGTLTVTTPTGLTAATTPPPY
ncbi:HNH endonuclease signature motif containing protein, partial [Geodermatophilus sp. SYSU D00696]